MFGNSDLGYYECYTIYSYNNFSGFSSILSENKFKVSIDAKTLQFSHCNCITGYYVRNEKNKKNEKNFKF
jgi:hypothetical protein